MKKEMRERINAELKKQELENQLQRSQRMEMIGTLAGGVAHDLNNVLSGLVSYPDLLLLQLESADPMRKPLQTIRSSGVKAAAIVQDLLTLGRRGVMIKEPININDVIEDYLESQEHSEIIQNSLNIFIKTDLQVDLFNIEGSEIHISKIIMNLISNAVDAMPAGGEILIKTENKYVNSPLEGYDTINEGDYAVLKVIDQGQGISGKDRDKIFEPFYTKKAMGRKGTGLGMSVVWGTVKDHGGYIDLQSVKGEGTRFSLYFPSTRKKLKAENGAVSFETYKGRGDSILIVDDVPEQREIATSILELLNYKVFVSASGEDAVKYLSESSVNLVILDMIMDPGIDGLDTYKRIIEFKPEQKVIIASGFSETERVKEAKKLGVGLFIKKPYTLEKIGQSVFDALYKNKFERADSNIS